MNNIYSKLSWQHTYIAVRDETTLILLFTSQTVVQVHGVARHVISVRWQQMAAPPLYSL